MGKPECERFLVVDTHDEFYAPDYTPEEINLFDHTFAVIDDQFGKVVAFFDREDWAEAFCDHMNIQCEYKTNHNGPQWVLPNESLS